MAKQYRILRKVGSVAITAGGFATIDLPRGYDYETLFMRISAQLTVSVDGVAVRAEAPCQLVPRIDIIADGKNTLFSAPFWFASLAKYDRCLNESGARATTPPTSKVPADYTVEAIGAVDFMTIDGARPKDSNFRTSGLSLFQVRFTFGNPGDVFTGGTTVFKVGTSPVVDVFTSELVEAPDANGNFTSPIALKKVSWQQVALASSNANQEQRLPAGNLIKSVVVRTDGSTTAGEPSTAVLNNLILQSGVDVRLNLSGSTLRAKNNADYGAVTTGYYIADLTSKGRSKSLLTELWDVTNQAEPKAIMDVTGGASVKADLVVTEYIFARA